MADINSGFSPISPLTDFRKDRLQERVLGRLEERRKAIAEQAARRAEVARQSDPNRFARERRVIEETPQLSRLGPRRAPMDEELLKGLELDVQRRRDKEFFAVNQRIAQWAVEQDDLSLAVDDLETLGFFESAGNAFSRQTDAMFDNFTAKTAAGGARRMKELLEDRASTLEEIQADEAEQQGAAPRTAEEVAEDQSPLQKQMEELQKEALSFVEQGRLEEAQDAQRRANALGTQLEEGAGVRTEDGGEEPTFVQELSSDAKGLWRFLNSRMSRPFTAAEEAEAEAQDFAQAEADILVDRGREELERNVLWPKARWRREIEQQLAASEGGGPMESVANLANVAVNNPVRFGQFLMEIGAESGLNFVAAATVMATTRNPALAAATSGLASFELSQGLAFNEFVADAGIDLSSPEGVQKLLDDPQFYDRLRDKSFRYGAVVGVFDGLSMGVAGKALSQSPVGNMVLQLFAQGTAGGAGELFGRLAAGEEINWTEVLLEAMAETITAPLEVTAMAGGHVRTKVRKARETEARQKMFNILGGKIEASELKKRDRKAFAKAIDTVTKDGPMENIYVDPERMEEMFQDGDMTLEEFFEATPELDIMEFNQARDSGSDFVIPMGVYASRIAGSTVDPKLSKHIRLKPDDLSQADAEQFLDDLQATTDELSQGVDRVTTAVGDLRGKLATEYERVRSELVQSGRAPTMADKEAALLVRSAQVGAERAGLSIDEYVTRYSLPAVRNADTVGPAPARPMIDPQLALELITSEDASVTDVPDVAAIRDLLDEKGLAMPQVTVEDVIEAARELDARGELRGQLPVEERALPSDPNMSRSDEEVFEQTATLRVGEEDPRDWGINPDEKNLVRDVALKLQARQRKKYGKINRKTRGPKTIEKMANWMADEIEFELQSPDAAAVGWYTHKFQTALDLMADIFPEFKGDNVNPSLIGLRELDISTSEEARAVMTVIIALTSNGTKVLDNFKNATKVYQNFRMTGRLTLGTLGMNDRARHTENSLTRFRQIVDEYGNVMDATAFLLEETTVKEANKGLKELGLPTMSKVPTDMRVPRASAVFGPKLGAFYANLSGQSGYLTMDLWWTRTINRYRGDVLPRIVGLKGDEWKKEKGEWVPKGVARFKHMIGRPDLTDKQALNYITEYAQRYMDKKFKDGTEAEAAANTLYKDIFLKLAEAPEGPSDRAFMIKVAEAAQAEVQRRTGQEYTIADIQAMIWYYEKRLYADMGAKDSGDFSYEEAAVRAIELERRSNEFFQQQTPEPEQSDVRDDVVSGTELQGDGRGFTDFFGDVTSGKRQQADLTNYVPVIDLPEPVLAYTELREKYGGNFDDHIKASIPGYSEMQDAVGYALAQVLGDGKFLRVGGSEGSAVKALIDLSGPEAEGVSMDPNVEMQKTFEEAPQTERVTFDLSAFSDAENEGVTLWTEDDGTEMKGFDPQGQQFDVVVEQMVFQFIDKGRSAQIARVKELMTEDGLFYTAEKVGGPAEQFNANEAQKDEFKAQFFSQEELAAKRAEVLQTGEDAVEGMTALQVSQTELERVMTANFQHVVQVWDSGNFKGYVGTDSQEKLNQFLEQLPSLHSRFSTVETPRVVNSPEIESDEFFQMADDRPAELSDFDAANLSEESFKRDGWAALSATVDSEGAGQSPGNRARAAELERQLTEAGLDFIEMKGMYDGTPDGTSFLVVGASDTYIRGLAAVWGQESILTKDGLVYTDASGRPPVPFDGVFFGKEAETQINHSVPFGRDANGERRPAFSLNLQFPPPADGSAPGTYFGAELKDGKIVLTHWSSEARDNLDPAFAGTGPVRGEERRRAGPKKTFFGLHIGKPYGYKREFGLGLWRHEVRVDPQDLYPWHVDPENLREKIDRTVHKSSTQATARYEELIAEAGYKGFFNTGGGDKNLAPLGDAAALFVDVEPDEVTLDNEASWTRSGDFNRWFADSEITNEDGSPKMVFHSTFADFEGFFPLSHFGTTAAARQRLSAREHFPPLREQDPSGARTIPAYLSLQNPIDVGEEGLRVGGAWSTTADMLNQLTNTLADDTSGPGDPMWSVIDEVRELAGQAFVDEDGVVMFKSMHSIELLLNDVRRGFRDLAQEDTDFSFEELTGMLAGRLEEIISVLEASGIDGVIYTNVVEDYGSTSYIAFRPGSVKSAFNGGNWDPNNVDILAQQRERKSGPRGSIILPKDLSGQAIIQLFDSANETTMLHETGHFFLWNLQRQARDGLEFAQQQLEETTRWFTRNSEAIATEASKETPIEQAQVEEYLTIGTTGNGQVDAAIHRAMHEQFARGWEAYVYEGKSPSNTMRALFESFTAWLVGWYKDIRNLNVNLDPSIRDVFDRLVATDEEIAGIQDRDAINSQIAETARELGLDEDSYRRLTVLSEEARDEGRQLARKELLRVEKQMRSAEYAARRAEIEKEETERVNGERHNRVIQWLAYGRWLGAEEQEPDLPLDLRLDTDLLEEQYGEQFPDVASRLPRGRRPMHVKGSGMTADEVAGWFGYNSGAEMLKDVIDAPRPRDAIRRAIKQRVAEEVGDPMADPEELESVVSDAMHGEKRGQVIVAELRALNRVGSRSKKPTSRQAAKQIAEDLIQKMPVREAIQTSRYQAAERRLSEEAARHLAEGRVDEAFEAKRKQLIQHQLYIASKNTAEMVGKAERLAGRLKRKGTRQNLAPEYLGAIDDILETYDFRQMSGKAEARRERLLAYVDAMKQEGRDNELAIPDHVLSNAQRKPYKTLSVQRLQGVFDSLKNIEHMARRKKKVIDAQEARERGEVIEEIREAFDENVRNKPLNRVPTRGERTMSNIKGYFNLVRNADTVLRKIDGWTNRGAAIRHIKDRIDRASVIAMQMREQATEDLDNLFSMYSQSERRGMTTRQVWEGSDEAMSKWDLISMALNVGNKDNFERLTSRDSRGSFTKEQVQTLLSNLDERDWRFVQATWDYIDTFWPMIAEREERVTGVAPEKVEPQLMMQLPGMPRQGIRGGYYPIKYDRRMTDTARADENLDLMQNMLAGRFGKAQTKNGHTKERAAGGGGRTLQLGMDVLFGHVNNVVHDLAYGEAVNTSWSILREPEVRGLFEQHGMLEDYEALEWWLQDVAAGPASGTHVLAGTMRRLKSGFTLSKLAFNMSTVAIQFTGLTQSMATIGTGNMVRGLSTYLFSARGRIRMGNDVKQRSPFMRERETSFQRDVFDLINSTQFDPIRGTADEALRVIMKAGFWAMQKVQYYAVDMPTWLGAHHQGLAQGMDDMEAAQHADRMVARAQASGLYADRSAIERGTLGQTQRQNEFLRLFTALGSYMFAKYNVAEEVIGRTQRDFRDPNKNTLYAVLKGATDMILLFTVEAVLYNAIKMSLPGMGDDDEDEENWGQFLLQETALSVASVFPFVRDASSAVQGFSGGGAYGGISETVARGLSSGSDVLLGEATASDARSLIDLSGLLVPGIPSTAIWRLFEGAGVTGEEPSPLAMILGR